MKGELRIGSESISPDSRKPRLYQQIYAAVRQIPSGRVTTYGQVARIVGRCTARAVGYAMAAISDDTDVPWHRIINRQGRISPRIGGDGSVRQRRLLEAEGIRFAQDGRVNLNEFGWPGLDWRSESTPQGNVE